MGYLCAERPTRESQAELSKRGTDPFIAVEVCTLPSFKVGCWMFNVRSESQSLVLGLWSDPPKCVSEAISRSCYLPWPSPVASSSLTFGSTPTSAALALDPRPSTLDLLFGLPRGPTSPAIPRRRTRQRLGQKDPWHHEHFEWNISPDIRGQKSEVRTDLQSPAPQLRAAPNEISIPTFKRLAFFQ
jgi:hypothetical protein